MDPADVCRRSGASFSGGAYALKVFNAAVEIRPQDRSICSTGEFGELLSGKLSGCSRLPILWYLLAAQDIPPSGHQVNPRALPGGLIFSRGTHILPLKALAARYDSDPAAFLRKGLSLGGVQGSYGDASITLYPFSRIPIFLVLWRGDDEFPANAELLLDDSCILHLPMDVVWTTAMMTVTIML